MALSISILKNILDFKCMHIESFEIAEMAMQKFKETYIQPTVVIHARPFKKKQCLCPVCHKKCVRNGYKQEKESYWRGPNLNGMPVYIFYQPQRILCPEHGALNEYIPWADGASRFTRAFNNEIAWLTCQMSKTAICEFENINWRTVGNCLKAAHTRLEPDVTARIHDNVRRICVDETSSQKGHKYITVVYDMDKNKVIWLHKGHGLEVFKEFCEELTEAERKQIEIVAGDGASWIDSCTREYFPNAVRCVDFFHVVQWANNALDEVRSSTVRKANREYNKTKNEYQLAEAEAAKAALAAEEAYKAATAELLTMPRRGRRSKRHKELLEFVLAYATMEHQNNTQQKNPVGRPKKEQFTSEHEEMLNKLQKKIKDLKDSKHALGHDPNKCTESQTEKLRLIENSFPDLYRSYQIKESLRLILHIKDYELAENELDKWIEENKSSEFAPIAKLAEKIERHRTNILNAVKYQANSAKSESTNTTIKFLIKLARGFKSIENMFALIYLKCSDIIIPLSNRLQPTNEYKRSQREMAMKRKQAREMAL